MEENEKVIPETEETENRYEPRPAWQVWAARAGVVIMIICVILYYMQIATAGR